MFLIAQAAVSNIFVQLLTVLLPMVLSGAYSIFCWLLAEPIVMPIWNNFIKPAYDACLQQIHNFGIACAAKWRSFWNRDTATQTTAHEEQLTPPIEPQPRPFMARICPLLFRHSPRDKTNASYPAQLEGPRAPSPQGLRLGQVV